jgi:hypothetical protein
MDVFTFSRWIATNYDLSYKNVQRKVITIQNDMKKFCQILYGYQTSDAINSTLNNYDYLAIWLIMTKLKKLKIDNYFEVSMLFWYCVDILDNNYTVQRITEEMEFSQDVCIWLLDNVKKIAEIRADVMKNYINPIVSI